MIVAVSGCDAPDPARVDSEPSASLARATIRSRAASDSVRTAPAVLEPQSTVTAETGGA